MTIKTLNLSTIKGKNILIRADLNVPLDKKTMAVSDATRIERFIPTVKQYTEHGARVIILSHFGRPDGKVVPAMSLKPVAEKLAQLGGFDVKFAPDCIGAETLALARSLTDSSVMMAENLRFYPQEESNDPNFAKELAQLGDFFVNDAFSCAHRAHASTVGINNFLPAYAGASLMAEVSALNQVLDNPARPTIALVGGAKISSKISVLNHLISKVDILIIGGGMANNFYAADGHAVGNSLVEPSTIPVAREVMEFAKSKGCTLYIPRDFMIADAFAAHAPHHVGAVGDAVNGMILDAGPQSINDIKSLLQSAKTLLWNGPLGAFELEPFDRATTEIALETARLCKLGQLTAVAGGGDTVSALNNAGVGSDFTFISTAGGAFLEWIEGIELPGIKALHQ